MSNNRYSFATELTGFINVYEDSGKYNNRCFSFTVPADVLPKMEADREELLKWAKSKVSGRVNTNLPKWDDEGLVKFSYGGETGRKEPVFVDTEGNPIERSVLRGVRKGTKVNIIVQQTPYTKPSLGTTLKVLGIQIVELASSNGAVDSGDLSVEDVAAMFGKVDGFKQSSPAVREADTTETSDAPKSNDYDF